jgi:hypothetical protein
MRNEIFGLASAINGSRIRYLAIHDEALVRRWWHIFTKVDHGRHLAAASYEVQVLGSLYRQIQKLGPQANGLDREFLLLLLSYVRALHRAAQALIPILQSQTAKSRGEFYTSTYRRDIAAYEQAQEDYRALNAQIRSEWMRYRRAAVNAVNVPFPAGMTIPEASGADVL